MGMSGRGLRARVAATATVTATIAATGASTAPVHAAEETHVLVGAGDIASCDSRYPSVADTATASLVSSVLDERPDAVVFTAGDNSQGLGADYECYRRSWGVPQIMERTRPSPGNHDYWGSPDLARYFDNFEDSAGAGRPGRPYYSYDLGETWRVIALDSNCVAERDRPEDEHVPGGCGPGSEQAEFLEEELGRDSVKRRCLAAYWHHPFVSQGQQHAGVNENMKYLFRLLYDAGADLVVTGHSHVYERFDDLAPDGERSSDPDRGIRQFVVGTGGAPSQRLTAAEGFTPSRHNQQGVHGVLRLTLRPGRYDWRFLPIAGQTSTEGERPTASCHHG